MPAGCAIILLPRAIGVPALFKAIEEANIKVAKWMGAEILPMTAQANALKKSFGKIEDRVFNVGLYAGFKCSGVSLSFSE